MDFTGQNILVTGTTRVIDRAMAESFLAAGGTVIGIYDSNYAAADEFIESGDWVDRFSLQKCDVSDSLASYISGSVLDINGGL
jgi:NAD(P)-dependent dehydrogenase (short-subunit alcohol dehydrogenase family)